MKRPLKVENLDCASCGAKIEAAVGKLDGVNSANLNFMTQKLMLDAEKERFNDLVDEINVICDRIEPGCKVSL